MKVFVNAVALKVAGGRNVLYNFLKEIAGDSSGHSYTIALPNDKIYDEFDHIGHIKLIKIPVWLNRIYFRIYIDYIYILKEIKKAAPDIVFSMGNIALPLRKCPQILLLQFAYLTYPEGIFWKKLGLKDNFYFKFLNQQIIRKLRYCKAIIVQTDTVRKNLLKHYGIECPIEIVSNGVVDVGQDIGHGRKDRFTGAKRYFLCFTRYYAHKNIETLLLVAELLKRKKLPYKLILTIEPEQDRRAKKIIDDIERLGLHSYIENIGTVKMNEIPSLFGSVDALLFPTLVESFSATYLEAASFKRPIFTSDMDFAHEICGDGAIYFNPVEPADIVEKLQLIENRPEMEEKIKVSYRKLLAYPKWEEVARQYIKVLENYK